MNQPIDYVFLHGGTQGSWVWADTIQALSTQTEGRFGRALALDVPGCGGKRGRATDELGPDEVAAELMGDIEAAGFRDIVLVGHSQAGTILPLMLALDGFRFRRAVYVSATAPLAGQTVLSWRKTMPKGPADPPDWSSQPDLADLRALFCNDMGPAQADAFIGKLGQDAWPAPTMDVFDWRYDHLGEVPASYVLCLRDAPLTLVWQEIFAERLRAQRLVRIDAGHQVMITRPHALAEALRFEAASTPSPSRLGGRISGSALRSRNELGQAA
jgi:pimeloyl-ACP methyl ester carboxylesterase